MLVLQLLAAVPLPLTLRASKEAMLEASRVRAGVGCTLKAM